MKYAIILFIALLLSACELPKSTSDYSKEAQTYIQANEISKAETSLKEGIVKHPTESDWLKSELFWLYLKTDLEKAEKYLEIASFSTDGFRTNLIENLASKFFEAKNWSKAFKYYLAYGDDKLWSATSTSNPCSTRSVAVESYRNAAAAAYNLRNKPLMRDALGKIQAMPENKQCEKDDFAAVNVSEIREWMREF